MQKTNWNESQYVGAEEIVEDHKRLFDLFNLLSHAVVNQESSKYVDALFEELIRFTGSHFRHEERLLVRREYDRLGNHKDGQLDLTDLIRDLQHRFHEARNQPTADNMKFRRSG